MRAFILAVALALPACASALEPGAAVPDLAARPLRPDGQALSLRALRGNVVYVDFWASWCVPCRESMPALEALYRKYGARGLRVVGVNKDVSAADAQRFLRHVAVTFPLVADRDDAIARAFDVEAMPSGYLIDRKGIVRRVHRGFTEKSPASLSAEIEALLKASP